MVLLANFKEASKLNAKEQSLQLPERARRGLLVNNEALIPADDGFTGIVHEWAELGTTRPHTARSLRQHDFAFTPLLVPHCDILPRHGPRTRLFHITFTKANNALSIRKALH